MIGCLSVIGISQAAVSWKRYDARHAYVTSHRLLPLLLNDKTISPDIEAMRSARQGRGVPCEDIVAPSHISSDGKLKSQRRADETLSTSPNVEVFVWQVCNRKRWLQPEARNADELRLLAAI